MYLSFYKLTEKPFSINTDPRFLWYGEKHGEALANLTYGLLEQNGYVVMTGDTGTGKTTLVNALIESLDDNVIVAKINHPTFGANEFLKIVAKTYDSTVEIASKVDCLFFFKSFLQQTHAEGKTALLIIDEAHRLPKESLEEIRLLSNMEQAHQKLINIFLAGQKELKLMLFSPECRALRQRITLFYDIHPLSEAETLKYVVHRLKVAGTKEKLFTTAAIHRIHNFTRGYPRLINILCDRAMLTGYLKEQQVIDADIVSECAGEISFLDPTDANIEILKIDQFSRQQPPAFAGLPTQKVDLENTVRAEPTAERAGYRATHVKDAAYQEATSPLSKKNQRNFILVGLAAAIVLLAFAVGIELKTGSNIKTAPSTQLDRTAPEEKAGRPDHRAALAKPQQSADNAESVPQTPVRDAPKTTPRIPKRPPAENNSGPKKQNAPANPQPAAVVRPSIEKTPSFDAKPNSPDKPATEQAALTPKKTAEAPKPTTLELATTALKHQKFKTAIDLVEADRSRGIQNGPKAQELYSKALVGRAGQVVKSSPSEAEALLRKAVKANPQNARAHFNLGKIYTQTKRYALAIDAYQNAADLKPNFPDAFFNLGFIHATTGNYKEAERFFARVVQLKPAYLDKALFNLALVQEKLGKKQKSLANLREALIVRPENQKVRAYLKQVESGAEESP